MGSINFGNQKISLPFEAQGTSININEMMYKVIPSGIYSGGALTKSGSNAITIDPLVCWIEDNITGLAVKVQTQILINLTVSSTDLYIILRFAWENLTTNYMDIFAVPFNSISPGDLIVGKCIYVGGVLQANFDYTEASLFNLTAMQSKSQEFLVEATEPYSSQVNVLLGKFITVNKLVSFTTSLSPALNNTTLGRIDLIYIDENGAIQKLEGIDSATPVAPPYSGKFIVAEIHRGALTSYITGADIVLINTIHKGIGLANIAASELNLGSTTGQIDATQIPIINTLNLVIANNVDEALTELSFGISMTIQAGSAAISIGDFVIFSGVGIIKFLSTSTPLQIVGLALQAGNVGDTIGIGIRKYVNGLSGLITGEIYWIGANGSLSLTDKSIAPYGIALSTTELLLL